MPPIAAERHLGTIVEEEDLSNEEVEETEEEEEEKVWLRRRPPGAKQWQMRRGCPFGISIVEDGEEKDRLMTRPWKSTAYSTYGTVDNRKQGEERNSNNRIMKRGEELDNDVRALGETMTLSKTTISIKSPPWTPAKRRLKTVEQPEHKNNEKVKDNNGGQQRQDEEKLKVFPSISVELVKKAELVKSSEKQQQKLTRTQKDSEVSVSLDVSREQNVSISASCCFPERRQSPPNDRRLPLPRRHQTLAIPTQKMATNTSKSASSAAFRHSALRAVEIPLDDQIAVVRSEKKSPASQSRSASSVVRLCRRSSDAEQSTAVVYRRSQSVTPLNKAQRTSHNDGEETRILRARQCKNGEIVAPQPPIALSQSSTFPLPLLNTSNSSGLGSSVSSGSPKSSLEEEKESGKQVHSPFSPVAMQNRAAVYGEGGDSLTARNGYRVVSVDPRPQPGRLEDFVPEVERGKRCDEGVERKMHWREIGAAQPRVLRNYDLHTLNSIGNRRDGGEWRRGTLPVKAKAPQNWDALHTEASSLKRDERGRVIVDRKEWRQFMAEQGTPSCNNALVSTPLRLIHRGHQKQQNGGEQTRPIITEQQNEEDVYKQLGKPPPPPPTAKQRLGFSDRVDKQATTVKVYWQTKCARCAKELGEGASAMTIESLRLVFHMQCFRCSRCNSHLLDDGAKMQVRDADVKVRNGNKLYCARCDRQ